MKNTISKTPKTEKDLAQTPPWLIDKLKRIIGITEFDLDVCSLEKTKKASICFSIEERGEDALALDWKKWNWCNPPFSNIMPFCEKAKLEAEKGRSTAMIMPNSPEVGYVKYSKANCDTFFEMPFRLKFLRPDGTPFLDGNGKEQTPQFSCAIAIYTPLGLHRPSIQTYYDFREKRAFK